MLLIGCECIPEITHFSKGLSGSFALLQHMEITFGYAFYSSPLLNKLFLFFSQVAE